MSATTSLVAVLKAANYADGRVYDLVVPEGADQPYIWLGRSGMEKEPDLDPVTCYSKTFVDLECVSDDPDTAINLADAVRDFLNGTVAGAFGTGTIAGIDAHDANDDYQIRNPAADDRIVVGVLNLTMHFYLEA